jgi:hypothetical protein
MARIPLDKIMTQVLSGGALGIASEKRLALLKWESLANAVDAYDALVGGSVILDADGQQIFSPDVDGTFPDHYIDDRADVLPSILGDQINPASRGWRRQHTENVFYPEDYGSGDLNLGVVDATDAIQACIDDCIEQGGGIIQFREGTYLVNEAPRTDRGGHCILSVAEIGGPSDQISDIPIVFRGVRHMLRTGHSYLDIAPIAPATIIKTTRTGDDYSASYGPPSVIGGWTEESSNIIGGATTAVVGTVKVQDICVQVANPNPDISGIDALSWGGLEARDCDIFAGTSGGDATVVPTQPHTFGVRWPNRWGTAMTRNVRCNVFQFYTGHLWYHPDHHQLEAGWASHCNIAYGIEEPAAGGGTDGTQGVYGMTWHYALSAGCPYGIAGVDVTTGVVDVPCELYFTNSVFQTEGAGAPFTLIEALHDGQNRVKGDLILHHFTGLGVAGPYIGQAPEVSGGQLVDIRLGRDGVGTLASAATLTIPPYSDVWKVSGSTTITDITNSRPGREVILIWDSGATFDMTTSGNLDLGTSITTATAGDTVKLVFDEANWLRVGTA